MASKPQSKSKIRISNSETNSKTNKSQTRKIQTSNPNEECFEFVLFNHLNLFRFSDFVLRNLVRGGRQLRSMSLRAMLCGRYIAIGSSHQSETSNIFG